MAGYTISSFLSIAHVIVSDRAPDVESAAVYLGDVIMVLRRYFSALLVALAFSAPVATSADTLLIEGPDQSKQNKALGPDRGQSMDKVTATWGQPDSKQSPIGDPPITRWEYSDFIVYFEFRQVIHAVLKR